MIRRKQLRFYYAAQTGYSPPYITIFTNTREPVPGSYQRYLLNTFREAFSLRGTPIGIHFPLEEFEKELVGVSGEIRCESRRGTEVRAKA